MGDSAHDVVPSSALMARLWSQFLVDAIGPVLAGSPFQAGQSTEPPTDNGSGPAPGLGGVTWCGGYEEVIHAYPPLGSPGGEPEENWCFDLTVEIYTRGRLVDVRLEHGDLPEAFQSLGLTDDASASAALRG